MRLTLDSTVVASAEQLSADLEGEAVVLGLGNSMYYGLNDVGTRIWRLLREPRRVADIRDVIAAEYEVDPATAERDVIIFLDQLVEERLVTTTT